MKFDELLAQSTPLAGAWYVRGHEAYRRATNQPAAIEEWLKSTIRIAKMECPRLLSIGAASGVLDYALAANFAGNHQKMEYVGIEPNEAEAHAFEARFGDLSDQGVSATCHAMPFESYESPKNFHVVMLIHSLYYFADYRRALAHAVALLEPKAELFVMVAPLDLPLSGPFREMSRDQLGHPAWMDVDVRSWLGENNYQSQETRIGAWADVTELADDHEEGRALLDFMLHIDTRDSDQRIRSKVVDELLSHAVVRENRQCLAHDIVGFKIVP
jgi:hypothetical protein